MIQNPVRMFIVLSYDVQGDGSLIIEAAHYPALSYPDPDSSPGRAVEADPLYPIRTRRYRATSRPLLRL